MESRVEISQIRYFMALCRTRSFTRAAGQCGVSQPSLSNAIRTLESELGGLLFQRSPFGLTPLGKAVRPHLQAVLRHLSRASRTAVLQTASERDYPDARRTAHRILQAPPHVHQRP
jgi:DNA-binding transcriptional LysR family regulator